MQILTRPLIHNDAALVCFENGLEFRSDGFQTVAFSVRAGHFEYESVVGVCKIASERMWQFESAPAHHTPPFGEASEG